MGRAHAVGTVAQALWLGTTLDNATHHHPPEPGTDSMLGRLMHVHSARATGALLGALAAIPFRFVRTLRRWRFAFQNASLAEIKDQRGVPFESHTHTRMHVDVLYRKAKPPPFWWGISEKATEANRPHIMPSVPPRVSFVQSRPCRLCVPIMKRNSPPSSSLHPPSHSSSSSFFFFLPLPTLYLSPIGRVYPFPKAPGSEREGEPGVCLASCYSQGLDSI